MTIAWTEIDGALRRQVCEALGYRVREGTLVEKLVGGPWCFQIPGPGWVERWGWQTEQEAWDAAFREVCGRSEVVRHKKGGIYRVLGTAKLALPRWAVAGVDGIEMMNYEHLAPHVRESWVRDLAEFREEGRFVRVTG